MQRVFDFEERGKGMKREKTGTVWKNALAALVAACFVMGMPRVLPAEGETAEAGKGEPMGEFSEELGEVAIVMLGADPDDRDAVYDGQPKDLVKEVRIDGIRLENRPKDTLQVEYAADDGIWSGQSPQGTEAGEYLQIFVRILEGDTVRYTSKAQRAVIQKASRELAFANEAYRTEASVEAATKKELEQGKIFDFTAVDLTGEEEKDSRILYSVQAEEPKTSFIDSHTGELTVRAAGEVTVRAALPGDRNHEEAEIVHTLRISAEPSAEGGLVEFDTGRVSYVVGAEGGIGANRARAAYAQDDGKISYRIADSGRLGLEIRAQGEDAGAVFVTDYKKLLQAVEAAGGVLTVEVAAEKEAGGRVSWGNLYAADTAAYPLVITCRNPPAEPYRICDMEGKELLGENGSNGWYRTAVTLVPREGYEIIRADDLDHGLAFGSEAVFGMQSGDQGQGKEWAVYLRETATGEITGRIAAALDVKLDSGEPEHLSIEFPETSEDPLAQSGGYRKDGVRYYGGEIAVTFLAYDAVSGVDSFHWEYVPAGGGEAGSQEAYPDAVRGEVKAQAVPEAAGRYMASLTLPETEDGQMKGILRVFARDRAGNSSKLLTDPGIFVVDTTEPLAQVTYRADGMEGGCQWAGDGKRYFSHDVEFIFRITEENFFGEDVEIRVSKDGRAPVRQRSLAWERTDTPKEYGAEMRLTEDGAYVITMDYRDRSKNQMRTYTSPVIVVDKTAPEMTAAYSQADHASGQSSYYRKSIRAAFTIRETNFFPEDVAVTLRKNSGPGMEVTPSWTNPARGVHVGTYTIEAPEDHGTDGAYVFEISYRDKSGNAMKPYTSGTMVVDTILPVIKVEYENQIPVTVQTDGEGNQRSYFSGLQTARITITEQNFSEDGVEETICVRDAAGSPLEGEDLYEISPWTSSGDTHVQTITYPGDANYTFDISCRDLAGQQAAGYDTDYFTVDTTKPGNLMVTYSTSILETVLSKVSFGFYRAKARVTVTATDEISGVHAFRYSYENTEEAGTGGSGQKEILADASRITYTDGGATGSVSFEIPGEALGPADQFHGTIRFTAADRAGNEADYLRDTKRIVVDTIAPAGEVVYNAPVQELEGTAYYDGDITVAVTVEEANFYPEDVEIRVTRDGADYPAAARWEPAGRSIHRGTFRLSGDGSYAVTVAGQDKSGNRMPEYTSGQLVIDTQIPRSVITVNGEPADGRAFRDQVVPSVRFGDENLESYEITLTRTSYGARQEDVTEQMLRGQITADETGGGGSFDTFDKTQENDGIYIMTVSLRDKAGHQAVDTAVFTVNRFGSVYEYSDYLDRLIQGRGAYVQAVEEDLVIWEYNADPLVEQSLNIEISRDGRPVGDVSYAAAPCDNDRASADGRGWFQYAYTIDRANFSRDGRYKIAVSSRDAAGNSPENSHYGGREILFWVDKTAPELTSITGLEEDVVNGAEQEVRYTAYDTIGLAQILVYVGDQEIEAVTDFSEDPNYYSGAFLLSESQKPQRVRLVARDLAGNITDTDGEEFASSYRFHSQVTVSTNAFVRWLADPGGIYGTLAGGAALAAAGAVLVWLRKKS